MAHARARTHPALSLDVPVQGPIRRRLFHLVRPSLSHLLKLPELNRLYARADRSDTDAFLQNALDILGLSLRLRPEEMARIPAEGPLLVVANHPFGAMEGIILAHLLRRVRPDVKLMANYMLSAVPEMRELLIAVDPFGSSGALKKNIGPLKASLSWLKSGHALGVFPAGEVSSLHLASRSVRDPQWNPSVARMAVRANAHVLPIYFDGSNSALFQILGLIHPRLRTVMLPREMLRKRRSFVDIRIGTPVSASHLEALGSDAERIAFLRSRTYVLKHRPKPKALYPSITPQPADGEPLAAPQDPALLEAEIADLPERQILSRSGEYLLFFARRRHIPAVVRELGRVREETFRSVGEGTGKPFDLDRFDDAYTHLVLWHRGHREIAGAYRIGKADVILRAQGRKGLYTATLFKFRSAFLNGIQPALELGRSFVRPNYQKSYSPLLTLWKGIGMYVARNPRYRYLFGPVSISNAYSPFSRDLMVRFMASQDLQEASPLKSKVRARTPPRRAPRLVAPPDCAGLARACRDIEDLGALISEVENDRKGVPVLLRQYMKLGGKVLAFNVDPDFSDALDGLILVDLTRTDPRVVARYMGADAARDYIARHKAWPDRKAS